VNRASRRYAIRKKIKGADESEKLVAR